MTEPTELSKEKIEILRGLPRNPTVETVSMNKAQTRKMITVPRLWRKMYKKAVTTKNRKIAMRLHCLECCAWVQEEVRQCTAPGCIMFPYRFGGWPGKDVDMPEDEDSPIQPPQTIPVEAPEPEGLG